MASRYEVEGTIISAKNLKNINWRHGPLKPYAVVWVDPKNKCSTRVDEEGDDDPQWNQKLTIPLNAPIEDSAIYIDIVHANAAEDVKPIIGSARLKLRDVVDEVGLGQSFTKKVELKRPSGRPHGKVEVSVSVREPRYHAPDPYYAPPYGVPPPASRDYPVLPPYGNPYTAAPPSYGNPYTAAPPSYGNPYTAAPPSGYPPYGAPVYGQPGYGQASYGQSGYGQGYKEEKKGGKYGMGTGLAVGAVAGVLGGLAIAEGVDYVEDKIADDVEDRVEDDLGYDDGGDDF